MNKKDAFAILHGAADNWFAYISDLRGNNHSSVLRLEEALRSVSEDDVEDY